MRISSKSIHAVSKAAVEWNGIWIFLQNSSMNTEKSGNHGTGFEIFFIIDPCKKSDNILASEFKISSSKALEGFQSRRKQRVKKAEN
ncbi:MAG: hypothetical protein PUG16_04870 [Lachnospiraceae bacterium]|nr:hypothetical protein [Lachnospiraceae bacterium]